MSVFLVDYTNPENYEIFGDKRLHLAIVFVPPDVAVERSGVMGRYESVYIDGDVADYHVIHEFTLNLENTWQSYFGDAVTTHEKLVDFYREEDGGVGDSEFTIAIMHALSEIAIAFKCEGIHWCYA